MESMFSDLRSNSFLFAGLTSALHQKTEGTSIESN